VADAQILRKSNRTKRPPTKTAAVEEKRFRATLTRSWQAAWKVAQYIHSQGNVTVQVAPLIIRPSRSQRTGYGDAADVLYSYDSAKWLRCEVKWRQPEFTCADDYPYPTIFIDRVAKIEEAPPDIYFNVNKAMTHAAIIGIDTQEQWTGPNTYFDRIKRHPVTVMECPIELVRFVSLSDIEQIEVSKEAA